MFARGRVSHSDPAVGLFTSLPILWNEEPDVAGLIGSSEAPHWARAQLAGKGPIVALDRLAAPGRNGPLDRVARMVMAQPRPLAPDENVALDRWVRGGGRLLLFADPMLTAESAFALGDPRRPQAVVLLSPILKRWGLELRFDDHQAFGDHLIEARGLSVPVNLPGQFATIEHSSCLIEKDALIATCPIGKGQVTAIADAAVLDRDDPDGVRAKAFAALLDTAFSNH